MFKKTIYIAYSRSIEFEMLGKIQNNIAHAYVLNCGSRLMSDAASKVFYTTIL